MAEPDRPSPPSPGPHRGVVAAYDPAAGYGTVVADGGATWWFHCTAIADGTRRIVDGARVSFGLAPGRQGRWEAVAITPA